VTQTARHLGVPRVALVRDAEALARLHAERVAEGFLPSLGLPFLTRLYRRIARSPRSCAFVVADESGIVAFAAGATSVGALYRDFIVRDGVVAGFAAAPRMLRSWRRVIETLRYPAATTDLPAAEVLAVATSDAATGRGYGRAVVDAVTAELARRGSSSVKVTVGTENSTAIAMYERCGFRRAARVHVHDDAVSEVLVWSAP
jgi:ribosomal protein S18 acetylase RimI-like enzyme